ncbi:MAG: hypothetical protein HZB42_14150 [Sphingobacteriales bacterium]|nr:hypothetical protein [Sphingobacteriales bacterium]
MKRVLVIIQVLLSTQLLFCQEGIKNPQSYITSAYSFGFTNSSFFQFGFERIVKIGNIHAGFNISLIPSYQYEPLSNIDVFSDYKNYYKQNLPVFDLLSYFFTGKDKQRNTGFYFKGGVNVIPFRVRYDYIQSFQHDTIIYQKTDKYRILPGFTGGLGFQFPLFGMGKRGRIEYVSRLSIPGKEIEVVMLMISAAFGF